MKITSSADDVVPPQALHIKQYIYNILRYKRFAEIRQTLIARERRS